MHPGETLTLYLGPDFVNYIDNSYYSIYGSDYPINACGTKSVLVKINNISFAIFGKNADGTYNDTIVGETTLPSIMLKCENGFTIYERTEGSKLAISIMDDGRVDLNNIFELYYDENTKIKDLQNNNSKTKIIFEDKNKDYL